MAPIAALIMALAKRRVRPESTPGRATMGLQGDIEEGWAEGYQVGAMVILLLIVLCNYKPGFLLHKLILIEARVVAM